MGHACIRTTDGYKPPEAATNSVRNGNQTGTQTYDAYGGSRAQTGIQLPFGFAGQQTDPESGLQYLRARAYDPTTGRFLSRGAPWVSGANSILECGSHVPAAPRM